MQCASNFLYHLEPRYIMTAIIRIRQYVIFIEPRKFNTADIKCFTVKLIAGKLLLGWQLPNIYFDSLQNKDSSKRKELERTVAIVP